MTPNLTPELEKEVGIVLSRPILKERKKNLIPLVDYIQKNHNHNKTVHLNFICTHNSRRSQFSQVWAYTAAAYYGVKANCFSGGVEVTSFNERAVSSLRRSGFIITSQGTENPIYQISYGEGASPITIFSKKFDAPENQCDAFAAVMTCGDAEENCPFIPGTEMRIPLIYKDPKAFDDTEVENEKYHECSLEIASELFYVFRKACN